MSRGKWQPRAAWAIRLATWWPILLGDVGLASAQEIEPNEFVPLPDGTTVNLSYFVFGHQGAFTTASGTNVPNSSGNLLLGVERVVHFDYIFGHPAGVQLIDNFGGISDPKLGGSSLTTSFGASNPYLSGYFWPYANFAAKQYLVVAAF